jgi:hypothetical protein
MAATEAKNKFQGHQGQVGVLGIWAGL